MPKLMNQPETVVGTTISNFGYSAKKITSLTATEYTLADIEIDVSPSTSPFIKELQEALKNIIETLKKSPRSENMLVRVQEFSNTLTEVHGFVTLKDINELDYRLQSVSGGTALYDAVACGMEAVGNYGRELNNMDYGVNGVVFIVTDGEDNSSKTSKTKLADTLHTIRGEEDLESLKVILIGVGEQRSTQAYLQDLKDSAKLDQYIWIGDASPSNLAKLAEFISKSISAASQSLGTGGASQNLDF